MFLNQEQVFPSSYDAGACVLDTGATNHMTGCRESLASLDETVKGVVRFGDGSKVDICGMGAVTIAGKNQDHRVLTEVYYISSLRCNIVSLGQLEEAGCRIEIDNGVLKVFQRSQGRLDVLIKAERKKSESYCTDLSVDEDGRGSMAMARALWAPKFQVTPRSRGEGDGGRYSTDPAWRAGM